MKTATKTQYGLRILLHIAAESELGNLAQGKDIAARQQINEPYLEQIMVQLKKSGLVATVRGRNGGYQLAREAAEVTLLDVIETFEGELVLAEASDGPAESISQEIRAGEQVWRSLSDHMRAEAQALTLADIRRRYAHRDPEYVI